MNRPFYQRLPPLALGAFTALVFPGRGTVFPSPWLFFPALALLLGSFFLHFKIIPPGIQLFCRFFAWGLFLGAGAGGMAALRFYQSYTGLSPRLVEEVELVLLEDPRLVSGGKWYAQGRLLTVWGSRVRAPARGLVLVQGRGDRGNLGAGLQIRAQGRLGVLGEGKTPQDRAKPGGGFQLGNLPFLLYVDGISPKEWTSSPARIRQDILSSLRGVLQRLPHDAASLLEALLLGSSSDPESPLRRAYGEAGSLHLLALSGFHVGLLALGVRLLFSPLLGRKGGAFFSLAAAGLYLFTTGLRPSLTRAVLMYTAWSVDYLRNKKSEPWGYLSLALIIQILGDPKTAVTLSFRLSYLALAGILGPGRSWGLFLSRLMPPSLAGALGASLGAQTMTLPLVLQAFGVWRPGGIVAALILTPLTALALGSGVVYLILAPVFSLFSLSTAFLDKAAEFLAALLVKAAVPWGRIPFLSPEGGTGLSWLSVLIGTILPLIAFRKQRYGKSAVKPRLPRLFACLPQKAGSGAPEAVGTEFLDQPRGPEKNPEPPSTGTGKPGMGNRPGLGEHDRHASGEGDPGNRL